MRSPAASYADSVPDVPMSYRVLSRVLETVDVATLRVAPIAGPLPTFRPAQFSMLGVAGVGEVPISISSSVDDRSAHAYTLRRAGAVTDALFRVTPGDVVTVRGPFGRPWDLGRAAGRHAVFVAGGIGLAPLRAAIDHVARTGDADRVSVLVGAVTPEHHLFGRWLATLQSSGVRVERAVDSAASTQGWNGHVGFVTDLIATTVDGDPVAAYVCGPDKMMVATTAALRRCGARPADIELTLERNMQCANGWCGHCQLGALLVCRDGPVVTAEELGDQLERPEL